MTNYAEQVANDLLAIGAVKFSPESPFTWASGIKSPIYNKSFATCVAYSVMLHFPILPSRVGKRQLAFVLL